MKITLLQCTPNYLKIIWCAARTCYSNRSPVDLWAEEPVEQEMLRLARHILKAGHLSVAEHCHMTFAVAGVSRTLLAQYSRHRIGVSLSVQSQRYVSAASVKTGSMFRFVIPPGVDADPNARVEFLHQLETAQGAYDRLLEMGIKKEDARFVLPGGAETNFVTSLNLRSFLDVYQKRAMVAHAQWEIKDMLREMARLLIAREPWLGEFLPLTSDMPENSHKINV